MKVIRVSDGKIFDSPSAVSTAYKKNISKDVRNCCEHWIRMVVGERFEWYKEDPVELDNRIKELKSKRKAEKKPVALRRYNHLYKVIYPLLMDIKRNSNLTGRFRASDLSRNILENKNLLMDKNTDIEQIEVNSLTNHLVKHIDIYGRNSGLQAERIYSSKAHRPVWWMWFDDSLIQEGPDIIKKSAGIYTKKVRVIDTNLVFESIAECSRATGIPRYIIKLICIGAISYVRNSEEYKLEFID